jgi:DNA polymerase-3 subunit alpha (Gram-positive type)
MKLAFLDTETTGLDNKKHEIIELALVIIEDGERIYEKSFKIKPRNIHTASRVALEINGYNAEVWNKEGFVWSAEACHRLAKHLDGAVVVGHNVQFDIGFLRQVFKEYRVNFRFPPQLDTKTLARIVWGFDRLSMDHIRENVEDMTKDGGHRALKDVEDCIFIYNKFVEKLNKTISPVV